MEPEVIKVCLEVSSTNLEFAKLCFEATKDTLVEAYEQYAPLIEQKIKG